MAKAGFLAKKSGFMMMGTETTSKESLDGGGLGLQPFSPATTTCASFRSPVGMAAACLRYPFTTAQWQELERQALIFKYMMASVPVPHHLLIPSSTTNPLSLSHSALSRGWFVQGLDPEPGRCRRTDGKKWRCSRDVAAPEKKYCERHMHRSRQRSRKHVEVHTDNTIPSSPALAPPSHSGSATSTVSRQLGSSPRPYPSPPLFPSKPDFNSLPVETLGSFSPCKDSKFMDWKHKSENSPMLSQDLQWLMQAKGDSERGASLYQRSYAEDRNPNLFTDFAPPGFEGLASRHQNEGRCLHMKPESEQRQMPRHFIDVGSNSTQNSPRGTSKSSANCNEKLSPFTLSLSMSSDNEVGEDMDQIQMGLGVIGSECDNAGGRKPQLLNWMSPVPWTGSSLGGPLGEVLQSSNSSSQVESKLVSPRNVKKSASSSGATNLMMDDWVGSRHTSPPRTAMSSPSGVLHRILTSPSDSSGGNSPTYKTAAMTEVVLQWMNQNK